MVRLRFLLATACLACVSLVATGIALSAGGGQTIRFLEVSRPAGIVKVPVVGGTGAYAGANGVFTSRSIGGPDSGKSADVFRLLP
jgi:hypothetical protein